MPWWPEDPWADMKAGIDCPMCADGHLPTNAHGDLIAELPGSYAPLQRPSGGLSPLGSNRVDHTPSTATTRPAAMAARSASWSASFVSA
jgi:hypothetical protein